MKGSQKLRQISQPFSGNYKSSGKYNQICKIFTEKLA